MPRIVTIFGATGTQGSSVVDALLSDGTFSPRATTRNPSSEAAKKLKESGVEVVQADLWDKESVKNALIGSEGVFGLTNFYDPSIAPVNPQGEIEQGKILIDAAKEAGVKFLVWSSLPNATEISKGKYSGIYHFDNKAVVEEYLKQSGLPNASLQTGWFTENLWNFGNLTKTDAGSLEVVVPRYSATSNQAFLWVARDLGKCVLALFKNYENRKKEIWNQTFFAVTARMTYPEFAQILARNTGVPVKFVSPPTTGMDELDEMYAYQSEMGLYTQSVIPDPRLVALGVKIGSLDEFAVKEIQPRFLSS